jgi:hypothetical protein
MFLTTDCTEITTKRIYCDNHLNIVAGAKNGTRRGSHYLAFMCPSFYRNTEKPSSWLPVHLRNYSADADVIILYL